MSSKAARRSAASSSSQSSTASSMSTPQVPSSSTSSVQSPMTPTRLSRIQEKNVLASLNDRLAAYIERNQVLENENSVMTKQLSQFEENSTRQTTRIKTDYEKEVMSLRKLVDETAKDKSKLDNDIKSLARDFNDVKAKLDKKSKDFTAVQKQLNHVENSLADLQATASKAGSERDKYLAEKSDLEGEVARLAREVDDLRKRLEHEALARVEAENILRHKSDEIAFQHQQYEKEITEVRSRRQVEIQEVDGRLQQEYELKLQLSIQELRAEYEAQLRANKDELDNLYDQKYSDLKAQLKRAQGSSASKSEEIMTLQGRLESSSASTAKFEQELTDLKKRIKEMERKNDEDHSRFAKMLETRDNEIEALVNEKTQLMNDYQDLMDTKVALDNEIATYRKLLEGEEKRLSISPRGDRRGGTPAGGRRGTPLRAVKRRRFDEESIESASEYDTNSVANGDVEILEDDPEGKFIRLHNKGDKDVTLSGWTLTRKTGEIETTHKFHRQMKLEPKGTTTIWSSDVTEAVHEPPTSLVMKGQKWFAGEHVTTTLMNNSGEEMASRETRRMQLSSQKRRLGFGTGATEELFHQAGDAQGDRCVIC